jgi:hypothetical protein
MSAYPGIALDDGSGYWATDQPYSRWLWSPDTGVSLPTLPDFGGVSLAGVAPAAAIPADASPLLTGTRSGSLALPGGAVRVDISTETNTIGVA